MFRFIIPIILIGVAVAGFVMFTNPFYKEVMTLRENKTSFNGALDNSKTLERERDKLVSKYNDIDPENLARLEKMLPNNLDSIRLILEIEKIAMPYGMTLKDVQYNAAKSDADEVSADPMRSSGNYGAWDLEFSTSGTYDNFINFLKDLEKNLRIVDVSSIEFSSNTSNPLNPNLANIYQYTFKIRTYWLRN